MVQTLVVLEVKVGARPDVEVAVNVGVVPKFCDPGLANVIVCVPAGVIELEAADAGPIPAPFVAVTVKVYAVPFVSPTTVMGDIAPVAVMPPGDDVTVYPVIDVPPVKAGAVKVTVARVSPAVAVSMVGEPGTTAFTVND
jgi:hypothetical protein